MNLPLILLGGGGHAKVLVDCVNLLERKILGMAAPEPPPQPFLGLPYLGDDAAVLSRAAAGLELVNAVGSTGDTGPRRALFDHFAGRGYRFANLVHPSAVLSTAAVSAGHGLQILAGAVVNPYAILHDNVLINTRAVVEHDCRIGAHSHIACGAVLCGACEVGAGVHIGAGAVINQGCKIGDGAIIASGSVVVADVAPRNLVAGVPAIKKRMLP